MTVSEIADQQGAGKFAEAGGRSGHTPGRIELAVLSEALQANAFDPGTGEFLGMGPEPVNDDSLTLGVFSPCRETRRSPDRRR
jgi:hypothetical protein